jgi:hypothetical protein
MSLVWTQLSKRNVEIDKSMKTAQMKRNKVLLEKKINDLVLMKGEKQKKRRG